MTLFPVGSPVRLEHGKPWKGAITMNGVARSFRDGLLVVERTFAAGGRYDSLGDEKRDGDHGTIEIVPGGWVLRRAYYRADGRLIGELFNIQTPVELRRGVVRYTDLEVDVVRRRDGSVEVVDEEDLRRTVSIGGIAPELADIALDIAYRLADILRQGGDWRHADHDRRQ